MIRTLQSGEAAKLIPMGEAFFKESRQQGQWNPQHFVATWERGIADGTMFALVVEEAGRLIAALGASIGQCPNTGDRIAAENFWYAESSSRGKASGLLPAFENEAKKRGVRRVWMLCLQHLCPERVGKVYERRGYSLRELCYVKGL